jgi:glycine hydroxymethyltransferase
MGKIAKDVGAYLSADMAHIAGLVATGEHPSPVPFADFVTTTTHKTLRGPRGGLILCRQQYAKALDSAVFPGGQGGPLMHIIAGKAVCFGEALKPSFKDYARKVVENCKAMADEMLRRGYGLLSGGTDNHLILIDLRKSHPDITGKVVQEALEKANITTNRNTVPGETRSPFQTSGLRLGSAAMTSRGFTPEDFRKTAEAIDMVICNVKDEDAIAKARKIATDLCAKYPLPY